MKQAHLSLVLVVALLALGVMVSRADEDAKTNPYESIAVRNPFQLKDPPPLPSADDMNKPPPPPLATVEVTGVVNMLSKKLALLEIVPGPGKPPVKETFEEGTRKDAVEVLFIDVDEGLVKIKNGDVITNIALKTPAKQPTGPAGMPIPGIQPGIPNPGLMPNATAGLPTVNPQPGVNPNNAANAYNNRGNVMVVGGSPAAATPTSPTAPSPIAKPYYGNGAAPAAGLQGYGAAPAAGASGNSGVTVTGGGDVSARTIPTRPIRNAQPQATTTDPAVQYLNMAIQEQQAKARGIPMPPLPPIPGLDQ